VDLCSADPTGVALGRDAHDEHRPFGVDAADWRFVGPLIAACAGVTVTGRVGNGGGRQRRDVVAESLGQLGEFVSRSVLGVLVTVKRAGGSPVRYVKYHVPSPTAKARGSRTMSACRTRSRRSVGVGPGAAWRGGFCARRRRISNMTRAATRTTADNTKVRLREPEKTSPTIHQCPLWT
jgi:hypothetical protein